MARQVERRAFTRENLVFSTPCQWHLSCLSLCVTQQPKSGAQFQRLLCPSSADRSIPNTLVRSRVDADADGLSAFLKVQGRLFGIAYRMLKSAADAEDIVQEVWIRWQTTDRSAVRDATAFLAATTARLAINVMQSARWRRETSARLSLRESVDISGDPELEAERSEALQSAILVLLEKLSPAERAAYVLREAFGYSYREIARILRLEEANTRQLVTRARRHVVDGRHAVVNSAEHQCFLNAFLAAAGEGALTALESFFSPDSSTARLEGGADSTDRVDDSSRAFQRSTLDNRSTRLSQHDAKVVRPVWRWPCRTWRMPRKKPFAGNGRLGSVSIVVGNEMTEMATLKSNGS